MRLGVQDREGQAINAERLSLFGDPSGDTDHQAADGVPVACRECDSRRRFQVFDICRDFVGLHPAHDLIPVRPTQHYSMGGIRVNKDGQAYNMAGITPKHVDVAEVHDCFTIAEMMAYENLGFAEPGEGKNLIQGKETYKEGSIPVNVDGGLLSKGHPIGATGGSQVRTIVLQLRDEAGDIQVKNPEIGLIHNIGGVGLYGNVTILGR